MGVSQPEFRLLLAAGLLAGGIAAGGLPAVAAQEQDPGITLQPSAGSCNQLVNVIGTGFVPSSSVEVWVGAVAGGDVKFNSVIVRADTGGGFATALTLFRGGCPAAFDQPGVSFVAVGPSAATGELERAVTQYTVTAIGLPGSGLGPAETAGSPWLIPSLTAFTAALLATAMLAVALHLMPARRPE